MSVQLLSVGAGISLTTVIMAATQDFHDILRASWSLQFAALNMLVMHHIYYYRCISQVTGVPRDVI